MGLEALLHDSEDGPPHGGESLDVILVVGDDLTRAGVLGLHASIEELLDLDLVTSEELHELEIVLSSDDIPVEIVNVGILLDILINAEGETPEAPDRNEANSVVQTDLHDGEGMILLLRVSEGVHARIQFIPVREEQDVSDPEANASECSPRIMELIPVQRGERSFRIDGLSGPNVSLFHKTMILKG